MLNPVIYTTQITRKLHDKQEVRYLYLLENILIINKNPELKASDKYFDLQSMFCQIIWKYEDNKLKEMILYDARLNQKKVYISTPDKLVEIQQKLKGKVFERNFSQFYTKIEVIKSHKNVEIILCKNVSTMEVKIAKIVKFQNEKFDESNKNSMIRNEAKIFQKLSYYPHPLLLGAEQIFIQEQCVIYVMSYCTGGTLLELLCENELTLPDQTTRQIMKQMLEGLAHLHKHEIMHRDIKLDNIMLERKMDHRSMKIIDFGYSTFFDNLTMNEQRCGTPGYIAPEVLNMQPYNELCDIYSAGCVFHALLTGRKINQTSKSTKSSDAEVFSKNIKISLSSICSIDALDLLEEMITAQKHRPSAVKCLQHQYFEEEFFAMEEFNTNLIKLEFPEFKNPFVK